MRRALRILLVAAGVMVLVVLVIRIGPLTIAAMLRTVRWGFLLVAALYGIHLAVRAAALWRSMVGGSLGYPEVLGIRMAGEAIEMLTFTGPFLAEPAKGYLISRRGLAAAEAYGAIAIEYLLYTLVATWMAAVALSMLLAQGLLPSAIRVPVAAVVGAMIAFSVACAWAAVTGIGLVAPSVRWVVARFNRDVALNVAARVTDVERVLVRFMHNHPRRLVEVLVIEVAGHALLVVEVWVILRSIGFSLAPAHPFLVEGGQKFINAAFFFVPGQIGASEGVYALLVASVGYPAAAGLTLSLVRRVRALIVGAVGLAVLTMQKNRP